MVNKCSSCQQKFTVSRRKHHCRLCGQAVCATCCDHWTKYPPMGYELPIRICDTCHRDMQTNADRYNLTPLAVSIELRQGVACMDLDETKGRLLTIGYDRMLMLWDVKPFVWIESNYAIVNIWLICIFFLFFVYSKLDNQSKSSHSHIHILSLLFDFHSQNRQVFEFNY